MKIGLEIFPVTIEDEVKEFSVLHQGFLLQYFWWKRNGNASIHQPRDACEAWARYDNFMYIKLVSMQAEWIRVLITKH